MLNMQILRLLGIPDIEILIKLLYVSTRLDWLQGFS